VLDEFTIVNPLLNVSTAGAKVSTVQLSARPNREDGDAASDPRRGEAVRLS
jgi:hypothetical protein